MKIFLFLLFPAISYGQHIYTGSIVNKLTKEKIPFATIGLIKENIGTNADEQGKFNLTGKYETDTLIISCVGYETLKIYSGNLPSDKLFKLQGKKITLKEVVIGNNYKATSTLSEFSNCGNNYYTSTGDVTKIAQLFQSPVANSLLSEINICKESGNSLFRIRIYGMDSILKSPSIDLADTIIEIKSRKQYVHIDLEKYKIFIPEKYFFVAIEWLIISYNEKNEKFHGKRITPIKYNPCVSIKKQNTNTSDFEQTERLWTQGHKGYWMPFYSTDYVSLISVKVKY